MKNKKHKHVAEYRSLIRSQKDQRSQMLFEMFKAAFIKSLNKQT